MPSNGSFSLHQSEKHNTAYFEVFDLGEQRFVIGRTINRDTNMGEFFMMARAKSLGRKSAASECAADALEIIRSSPEDEPYFWYEDAARELELLDKVSQALLTSLLDADAFRSSMTFCKIMKISGSDAVFHGFSERWRPAAAPTEAMILQAATEMEESFMEQYGDYHAVDLLRIRSEASPPLLGR
jgi:hypothetical protein